MSFTARTREEIARLLLGNIIARSEVSDTNPGSVLDTITQAHAAVLASIERNIESVRDAFDFRNATGAELDKRLEEFPPNTVQRQTGSPATGTLELSFTPATTAEATLNAGSTFSRSENPSILYATQQDYTIPSGTTSFDITVICNEDGTAGNCNANTIDTVEDGLITITSITNQSAFTNGKLEENDEQLKKRALLYLQSLNRCTSSAIEYASLSFDDGIHRLTIAQIKEDLGTPGLSYLYVDDGSGQLGDNQKRGVRYTGAAGQNGLRTIYFDAPAVNPPILYLYDSNNIPQPVNQRRYITIPERGILQFTDAGLTQGQTYILGQYNVYDGFIKALQEYLEGDPNNPTESPGFRPAGTRVQVRNPSRYSVDLDLNLIPRTGFNLDTLTSEVKTALNEYISSLGIGETLFVSRIIDTALDVEGVLDIKVYEGGTGDLTTPTPLNDIQPPNLMIIRLNNVKIIPTAQES
jgi:uncharacterized phage protein gp47/JayE